MNQFENAAGIPEGRIIQATSSNTKKLNAILTPTPGRDTPSPRWIQSPYSESGATFVDEKIAGSLHFTPGQAYEICGNGNRSAIHWDMVLIQRRDWGGGEIWFDGELIRKDGLFLPKDLQPLNPDRLK